MPPVVIDLHKADEPRDVVHIAVQALAEGKLVSFPTETLYGVAAGALCPAAVERLLAATRPSSNDPPILAIKSAEEALDYVPAMSSLGQRLARRCWPGPVTLVFANHHPESLIGQLPSAVAAVVTNDNSLAIRVPAHALILDVLRMAVGPVVLTTASRPDQGDPQTAQQVVQSLGDSVHLVLDDGRTRYGQPSSVVRVSRDNFQVLRGGVVSQQTLRRLASCMVLFVCTGNTCRSPMAERIFADLAARKLGCKIEELAERGLVIESAGLAASTGGGPSPEAVQVLARSGIDLSRHHSQPVTESLVRQADLILAMTRSHRAAILDSWPEAAQRTQLVRHDRGDVSDPIGGPLEVYSRCAEQIRDELEKWVAELELP